MRKLTVKEFLLGMATIVVLISVVFISAIVQA